MQPLAYYTCKTLADNYRDVVPISWFNYNTAWVAVTLLLLVHITDRRLMVIPDSPIYDVL